MSSSPPPPPPGPPPTGPPPPPPPTGSPPPPPPPPPSTSVTSTNYFFGFVITFVVLLLLFIGCGLGSWRRFRLVGTAWDVQLQDMEGTPFTVRRRARRRLVRPTFLETWTSPASLAHLAACSWQGVQPISAALVWSRSTLGSVGRWKESADVEGSAVRGVGATLRAHVCPRHRSEGSSRPPPIQRPPPEAIQVAVMIAMPSQLSGASGQKTHERCYVGRSGVGEYEIGVVRMPWPSGEGP